MSWILNQIRGRPQELLGEASNELLESFLNGWLCVAWGQQGFEVFDERKFEKVLRQKYALSGDTFNTFSYIRLLAGEGSESFHRFFEELDSLLRQEPNSFAPPDYPNPDAALSVKRLTRTALLENIRRKPGMYLRKRSVRRLRAYMDGHAFAFREAYPDQEMDADLDLFERWLCKNENWTRVRWERLALLYSQSDVDALDWFFEKFDKWNLEVGQTVL